MNLAPNVSLQDILEATTTSVCHGPEHWKHLSWEIHGFVYLADISKYLNDDG